MVFDSDASNLVEGDTNNAQDVFVHDRQTGETTRVSISSAGEQGNDLSGDPSISADVRFVAFASVASNLVEGDTNGTCDIFVRDQQIDVTERVSVSSAGEQGNSWSQVPSISADGRYVAFASSASNLVEGDTNGTYDIFVRDRQSGETRRISVSIAGEQGNGLSWYPSISADGRYVAFESDASNLAEGDTNGYDDVFVHDRQSGETRRISLSSAGGQGNNDSYYPSISADGRYVAFVSEASNLVEGGTNNVQDVFVHDRQNSETRLVSVSSAGEQGNDQSFTATISADGRYVAFASVASNLVEGDTNGWSDVFVHDRESGETRRISVSSVGEQANNTSWLTSITADGRYVAFESDASNLVEGDTNGWSDVFVHDREGDGEAGYSISGQVTLPFFTPIEGVTISAGEYNAITDSQGNFTIPYLTLGTYRVVPSYPGYIFTPSSSLVSVPPDRPNINFIGQPLEITDFQVNQGLGHQKDGEQNYVAGKATALRVFLNLPIETNPTTQHITVNYNGSILTELYPKSNPERVINT